MQNFNELQIDNKLKNSISAANFKIPTPIQIKSIPLGLNGKDILGTAQTGTGKTLAFTIPMINKLILNKSSMALIVCPTRELASQVMQIVLKLNVREIGIGNALLIGGEGMQKQLRKLNKRARIIVGTPGRINDHLKRKSLNLSRVTYLVLDETDRMLDMGFTPQIEHILKFIPKNHQTLLFSATLPNNILKISDKYLNKPERISVGSLSTPIEKIKQETFQISQDKKYHELINQLIDRNGSILVFVKTKHGADKIVKRLKQDGHSVEAIHGNLRQSKRQRVINGFRNGKYRILIATDVASRGLDIPLIQHVINYDLPQVPEDYIHRIGRTGRAGKEGTALTFLTNHDKSMWRSIQKLINPNFKLEENIEIENVGSIPLSFEISGMVYQDLKIDGVWKIEEIHKTEARNDIAASIIESGTLTEHNFWEFGLNGTGILIAVADTGVDLDHACFRENSTSIGEIGNNHRKIQLFNTTVDEWDSVNNSNFGHGTHIAGSLACNWDDGNLKEGTALSYDSKLLIQDIVSEEGWTPPENAELIAESNFCPYAAFRIDNHILTFQGHPEFQKAYSKALILYRQQILGPEVFEAGIKSLEQSIQTQEITHWMINFLRNGTSPK